MSDRVEVYKDEVGEWRWKRIGGNGEPLSSSTEGYVNKAYCVRAAVNYNSDVEIVTIEGTNDGE